jgi:hypothetical protein
MEFENLDSQDEREIRAARNQSLFRAVNEQIVDLTGGSSHTLVIACECADPTCIETVEIDRDAYLAVRREPRRFVVRPGHIYPEVENVMADFSTYVVVEKVAAAGELAEQLEPRPSA